MASSTRLLDGSELSAPSYVVQVNRAGRQFNYFGSYTDIGKDFRTQAGFVPRPDIRDISQFFSYFFRPEGENLISWGPEIFVHTNWDHEGVRLNEVLEASLEWEFTGQTQFEVNYRRARERLRPEDFSILQKSKDFDVDFWHIEYGTSFADTFSLDGNTRWGKRIHVDTLPGQEPFSADWIGSDVELGLRPVTPLRIDNTYFFTRLVDPRSGARILSDHIFRSHWNWQFTRELSLRIILQYEATLTETELTRLPTRKNFNGDLMITYRVNPWTVLYVGYNGNAQNMELISTPTGRITARRDGLGLISDAKQLFVKLSYLFRF